MMTNGRIFQNFFTIVLVLSLCAVIFLLFKPSQLARRTFIIFLFVMLSFRIPLSFKSRCKNLLVLANSLEDRFQTKCRGVLYHVEYSAASVIVIVSIKPENTIAGSAINAPAVVNAPKDTINSLP